MSEVLRAEGAPVEQGRAQGAAFAAVIRAELARRRAAAHWLARAALARRVRATSARALETQLPWQRERIEGLAQGARVSERALLVAEAETRVQGAAFFADGRLEAVFDVPREQVPLLVLRRSAPDAGGFPSVELALAPLAGCLCGVNAEGIAVVLLRDRAPDEPSLRFHAQELLFRARDLDAGVDHLRRRASYAGGSGALAVADARGSVRVLRLAAGRLSVDERARLPPVVRAPQVRLDTGQRRLVWLGVDGARELARLEASAR